MADKKRRTCTICGAGFVPTGNNQKYCPDCRKQLQENGTVKEAYLRYQKARQPGSVIKSQIETPEDNILQDAETRQEVGNNESGGSYENVKYFGPFVTMYEKEEEPPAGGGGHSGHCETVIYYPDAPTENRRDLPEWEQFVEDAKEILLRYGRGELIDKEEFLARIRERLEDF